MTSRDRVSQTRTIPLRSRALALLLVVCTLPFLTLSCATKNLQYGRVSGLEYFLTMEQKPGERLENVTLYVPFPRENDRLQPDLLKKVKEGIGIGYNRGDAPRVEVTTVETKHGKMLKMRVSKMAVEGRVSIHGLHVYANVLPFGRADVSYPLVPLVEAGSREKAPIFIDYEGASGFYLRLRYEASSANQYLPEMPRWAGTAWVVGKTASQDYEVDKIWVEKQGWNEISVWRGPPL